MSQDSQDSDWEYDLDGVADLMLDDRPMDILYLPCLMNNKVLMMQVMSDLCQFSWAATRMRTKILAKHCQIPKDGGSSSKVPIILAMNLLIMNLQMKVTLLIALMYQHRYTLYVVKEYTDAALEYMVAELVT